MKQYKCNECGHLAPKKFGICPKCKNVGTFEEIENQKESSKHYYNKQPKVVLSSEDYPTTLDKAKDGSQSVRLDTGLSEFNNVLGGGVVADSVNLLHGDPGIGKSTLLMHTVGNISKKHKVLYATGEESTEQVKDRAKRLGIDITNKNLLFWQQSDIDKIIAYIKAERPRFVVIDSMQTMFSATLSSLKGSPTQLKDCCDKLISVAKENNEIKTSIFIVGHNTKNDEIAGPKTIAFIVDGTFAFESDQFRDLRIIRSTKNRFGNANEIGVFEMKEDGLKVVENPSQCFLEDNGVNECGSVITCIMEGTRPILAEVQSLVNESAFGQPRRMASGIDYNRTILICAILENKCNIPLGKADVYVNIAGGLKVNDRSVDLAIASAVINASAKDMKPISKQVCFLGELGLTGEVRYVYRIEDRIRELVKNGFTKILIPYVNRSSAKKYKGVEIIPVKTIKEVTLKIVNGELS